ncbi:MAG: hypothetical protein QG596_1143 [Actinomycetota bacterium]|jgi:uncharacterized protein YndB with AHSA1/START domain|nr:hypothetical protein [Actinomycetota bacterium]
MTPEPSGEVERTDSGRDLILTRTLPVDPGEGWAWITESPKLEKWFGTWTGAGEAGGEIQVTMNAEAEESTSQAKILACEPGRSYELTVGTGMGEWHLELLVEPSGAGTGLTFTHHLDNETPVGSVGSGWEYYLDRLLAAIGETGMPDFDDYYPSMEPYYEERG